MSRSAALLSTLAFLMAPVLAADDTPNNASAEARTKEESRLEIGGEVRMRGYNLQNFFDFDDNDDRDNWSVFRYRASLHARARFADGVTGFLKITNQHYGEGVSEFKDNQSNKIFVDNAYIDVSNFLGQPFHLRLGRQDLVYGSGFVLFDGQSQFASTSNYLDGIKLGWTVAEEITLDALYFKDQENQRDNAAHDDITLSGLYLTVGEKAWLRGSQELYLLNRKDEALGKDINMIGLRLSEHMGSGFDYSVEFALQGGDAFTGVEQDAHGGRLEAGYSFNERKRKPRVFARYLLMSGDDPETPESERWDVFYGGWPQFGDLLAWKYVNAGTSNIISTYDPAYASGSSTPGEAVYSNLSMITAGASASFSTKLSGRLSVSRLTIDQTSGSDDFGVYTQAGGKYQYSKALSFSFYAALITPGDAFPGVDDNASEFFWEARLKF